MKELDKTKQLLKDVSPHILYEISEKYKISYIDLMTKARYLIEKKSDKETTDG